MTIIARAINGAGRNFEEIEAEEARPEDSTAGANDHLSQLNDRYCVVPINGKIRVLTFEETDGHLVATFFTPADFRELFGHLKMQQDGKIIGLGAWWLRHPNRRQYAGICFKPGQNEEVDGRLNVWRGFGITPSAGDWSLLHRHMADVLAAGDPVSLLYIIKWTAWTLQNPGKMAEVALVFRGGRGTGKGVYESWSRLSEQNLRLDKWSPAGVRLPGGAAAS